MKRIPAMERTSGFGLIELMVAMAIGLIITAAALTLFLDMTRSNTELAKVNAQMENGRLAIQLMRDDLMHVGFWNGFVPEFDDLTFEDIPADYPAAIPAPCAAYSSWTAAHRTNLIGIAVDLYDAVPTGCAGMLPDKLGSSDVLVVRHVESCIAGGAGCEAYDDDKLYWQTSFCESDPARYALAEGADLDNPSIPSMIRLKRDCLAAADKRKFVNNIYYLRNYAVTPGDGIPMLMRSSFDYDSVSGGLVQLDAEEMIEGIEAMRFEFGVDNRSDTNAAVNHSQAITWADDENRISPTNRGDGAADTTCTSTTCDLDALANTVLVTIHLLVRNLEVTPGYVSDKRYVLAGQTYGPFSDGFKRHVYSTTVRLINVSGRRETP